MSQLAMHMKKTLHSLLLLLAWPVALIAQTNLTDSLLHQNLQRQFMVHFPPGFSTSQSRPLVVNLHGGSGNMLSAQGFSQMNPVADQNNFVVAWPQGIGVAAPGFSWADGRNTSADQAGIDDIGFIHRLVDTLLRRYNIDSNRIYLCGFSNGGFMVQRLACQSPGKFAAMASLGASMDTGLYRQCAPPRLVPMAFFNGTADPAMPYNGGPMQNPQVRPVVPVDSAVQSWVRRNQCQQAQPVFHFPDVFVGDSSTAQLFRYSQCACQSEVLFYKLINGGHTWPGVFVPGQAAVLGNTNRDIQASLELWQFFNAHPRCQTATGLSEPQRAYLPLKVFPVPAQDWVQLDPAEQLFGRLELRDMQGSVVKQMVADHGFSVADLPNGLYQLFLFEEKRTYSARVIVRR